MARRYINRIDDAADNDEWSYISKLGPNIEFKDVMDVEQRYITFGNQLRKKSKPKQKPLQATKEGIRWALDAAGNTGQYIKFVNMTIDKKQTQINQIKKLQEKFDDEIELLKSHKLKKITLNKKTIKNLHPRAITEYLNQLLLEKRITQTNLKKLRKELVTLEGELKFQEKQIEQVQKHVKAKILQKIETGTQINITEAIKIIRDEISSISQQYDVTKLSGAVEKVLSSQSLEQK